MASAEEISLVIQLNGKVRNRLTVSANTELKMVKTLALASPKVRDALAGTRNDEGYRGAGEGVQYDDRIIIPDADSEN